MNVTFDIPAMLPMLIPLGALMLVLIVDLIVPKAHVVHIGIALLGLVGGLIASVPVNGWLSSDEGVRTSLCTGRTTCLWVAGPYVGALQFVALFGAIVVLILATPSIMKAGDGGAATWLTLVLAGTVGAVGVAASRDAASWLISLELATVPVIVLVALPGTRGAIAGAVQLLTTSLTSFAMLVLGTACWYAASGTIMFLPSAAVTAVRAGNGALLTLAVILILAGLAFKLSLVPFHAWTPTTYAGAPVPVAAFLAATSKVAALGALMIVLYPIVFLGRAGVVAIAVLALGSMTLGNIIAFRQEGAVRLLAWSTVAQAGWVVLPLLATAPDDGTVPGLRGAATYLIAYVLATLVAFCVVASVWGVGATRTGEPAGGRLTAYQGLLRRQPLAGLAMLLALTSLAGLPPGIIGLVGKIMALVPVVNAGWWIVGILAAANAVFGAAVYLRWLRYVVGSDTTPGPVERPAELTGTTGLAMPYVPSRAPSIAMALSLVALVAVSVVPQLVLGYIR